MTNGKYYLLVSIAWSLVSYGICLPKDKAFSCCKLGLQITDARFQDADAIFPNTNNDGSRVFVSYVKEPAVPGQLEAELFANNNGTLSSLATVAYDGSIFNSEGLGLAAPDFQNLFLLDSDDSQNIRVRKYDSNLVFTGPTVTFSDYGDDASLEAAISADGKFIAITYESPAAAPNETLIRVLETQNLQTVATASVAGITNGPRWFTLKEKNCCQLYFALVASDLASFSTLHVYKFKNNTIIPVASASLPQFANIPAITLGCCDEVLIATGGRQAFDGLNAPSVFPASTVAIRQTFIPGDTSTLRLYSFSDSTLNLVYKETLPAEATRGITFHPNNKCLLVSQIAPGVAGVTGAVASFRCVQPCKRDKCDRLISADASISSSASTIVLPAFDTFNGFSFSTNGEWFITGGASNTGQCGDDIPLFRNVNLYRVTPTCAPCHD